jgi:MFS transporter, MHS family, metabolite:H+ symporter
LEYYDFALYGLASALIFSKLFFTSLAPAMGLIASFATFGVGFVARPLGGLFFGTYGAKLGRKWVLVATILLMGGASTLVGRYPRTTPSASGRPSCWCSSDLVRDSVPARSRPAPLS